MCNCMAIWNYKQLHAVPQADVDTRSSSRDHVIPLTTLMMRPRAYCSSSLNMHSGVQHVILHDKWCFLIARYWLGIVPTPPLGILLGYKRPRSFLRHAKISLAFKYHGQSVCDLEAFLATLCYCHGRGWGR